jgi:hypothetical protein
MLKIKVSNAWDVKNQFLIKTDEGTYFQSYDSVIAFIPNDFSKTQLDETYWDYSRTTGKYRNKFLGGETLEQTRKKIKNGDYILTNLN